MIKLLKRSIILLTIVIVTGCGQQGTQGEEPTIQVKLADGQINKMNIEEYVAGVVAGEMKKGWPKNAYAAQAIIARTFTLKRLEENGNNTISAKHEEAQAYRPENISSEIRESVKMTKGEVITYQNKYIRGWFHSSAGGQTTSAKVGLAYKEAEPPYIQSIKSPDDLAPADIKNWQVRISKEEILRVLEQTGEKATEIKNIKVLNYDKSGRIIDLELIFEQGSKKIKGAEFRTLIGPDKLKSILIKTIKKSGDSFIFAGSGYGHGVGMSQWGAYKLAKEGKTAEEIINYYFKDIKIVKRWD